MNRWYMIDSKETQEYSYSILLKEHTGLFSSKEFILNHEAVVH